MTMKARIRELGATALERALTFDETNVLQRSMGYLKRTLKYEHIELENTSEAIKKAKAFEDPSQTQNPTKPGAREGYNVAIIEAAEPGSPAVSPFSTKCSIVQQSV